MEKKLFKPNSPPLKIGQAPKGKSSSNHPFSGAMLVWGRVLPNIESSASGTSHQKTHCFHLFPMIPIVSNPSDATNLFYANCLGLPVYISMHCHETPAKAVAVDPWQPGEVGVEINPAGGCWSFTEMGDRMLLPITFLSRTLRGPLWQTWNIPNIP